MKISNEDLERRAQAIEKAIDKIMEETSVVKPPIPLEVTGSPLEYTMKHWLDGINDTHPSLPSFIIEKEREEDYEHNIVEKVSITDKAYIALYRVAETIFQHMENKTVLIVQSVDCFGNSDVPFAMCFIKHDKNCIEGYFIDTDYMYYKINDEETKWKPCYHNSEMLVIQTNNEGDKVQKAWKCILKETPGEDVSALKFFDWVMDTERVVRKIFNDWRNFKYELYEFLKDRYMYTIIDFLKDNSSFLLSDALEMRENDSSLNFDDPCEEYTCDFYVIYER